MAEASVTVLNENEIKKTAVSALRKSYLDVGKFANNVMNHDVLLCHKCGKIKAASDFYTNHNYGTDKFPICKTCVIEMVTDYNKKTRTREDNKEKIKHMLQIMDLPYIDSLYNGCVQRAEADVKSGKKIAWSSMIVQLQSLPQYKGKNWNDSEFELEVDSAEYPELDKDLVARGRKMFGWDMTDKDVAFLQTEYDDWTSRYMCESKAQEILFQRICSTELAIRKAQRAGEDTRDLDRTLQDLMSSLGVKPAQSNSNALTEAKSFGQLIGTWEEHDPIPELDEQFKDVDNIGRYIDVFFKGHMAWSMGIKNAFSNLYYRFMKKYTVTKPEYEGEDVSEELFDKIYGGVNDGS